MLIHAFHDSETGTLTYVVADPATQDAVIIDPVWNFNLENNSVSETSLNQLLDHLRKHQLRPKAILETHAHADHLTAAQRLKEIYPATPVVIGERIKIVQKAFHAPKTDASQFDRTLNDFAEVQFGSLKLKAIPTPGHTPACMSYLIGDALFSGDALFMPDAGTGRCDFPEGSARTLYQSIQKNIYTLPDDTRIFVGHDYCPNGRELRYETSVGESKRSNIHIKADTTETDYVNFREARDKTLKEPRLLKPSMEVNLAGGRIAPGMHRARE